MTSLIILALYLVVVGLFLLAIYVVVNRAVLHALRTHHAELRTAATPGDRSRPGG
ncbi:hypothetical protein [Blastococcus montanus]|uniref:hypothetical protein n=1 Tax=Blastococcus montanus TaxID=3144973 RepID=UPI0032088F73